MEHRTTHNPHPTLHIGHVRCHYTSPSALETQTLDIFVHFSACSNCLPQINIIVLFTIPKVHFIHIFRSRAVTAFIVAASCFSKGYLVKCCFQFLRVDQQVARGLQSGWIFLYLFQKQVLSSNVNILSNFFGHIVGISSVSVPDCPWSEEKVLDLEFCRLAAALQCGDLAKVVICWRNILSYFHCLSSNPLIYDV